jgi:hypothetical protein
MPPPAHALFKSGFLYKSRKNALFYFPYLQRLPFIAGPGGEGIKLFIFFKTSTSHGNESPKSGTAVVTHTHILHFFTGIGYDGWEFGGESADTRYYFNRQFFGADQRTCHSTDQLDRIQHSS